MANLVLKSDMEIRNGYLRTATVDTNVVAPLRIGAHGNTAVKKNITIRNIHINGRRAEQHTIGTAGQGGRHGIYIVGPVQNILIEDCTASYCGTDGLCIYGGEGMDAIRSFTTGLSKEIVVRRSVFRFNRRHGASIDSVTNIRFEDCEATDNGTDIGPSEGEQGARFGALLYGNGVDIEEYGGVKTYTGDVTFTGGRYTANAGAGIWCFAGSHRADEPGWVPRTGFTFENLEADYGVAGVTQNPISMHPQNPVSALGWYYNDVTIRNCTLRGVINLRAVQNAVHDGGVSTPVFSSSVGHSVHGHVTSKNGAGQWTASDGGTVTYL